MLLALAIPARAEELNVSELISKLPALNQGVAFSIKDSNFNYLATVDAVSIKGFKIEVGYAGVAKNTGDKIVGVASYDLLKLKNVGVTLPILDLVEFRPGVWLGYGHINGASLGDSEFDYGVSLSVLSVKF
jgi:hypothetical protein